MSQSLPQFTVRNATQDDIERVVSLYREGRYHSDSEVYPEYAIATYQDDEFYEFFKYKIEKPSDHGVSVYVGVNAQSEVVGFLVMGDADEELQSYTNDFNRAAELHQIYIDPEYQGQGLGKALFQQCQKDAQSHKKQELFINVLGSFHAQNEKAIGFYERMGASHISVLTEEKLRAGQTFQLKCPLMKLCLKA
jgi:ribosomal protein S18 acetylase RimI-like enzyme